MVTVLLAIESADRILRLKGMISWLDHDYQIVGEETEPEQVTIASEAASPDILLLSTTHFGSLAPRLRDRGHLTGAILLAQNRDFDELQNALHLGADDFLVWDELTPRRLLTALGRCRERVRMAITVDRILKREFLRKIIEENTVFRSDSRAVGCFAFDRRYSFVYFIVQHSKPLPLFEALERVRVTRVLTDEFFQSLPPSDDCEFLCSLYLSSHICGALYRFTHTASQRRQTQFILQQSAMICHGAKEQLGQVVSAVAVGPFGQIEMLHSRYHERLPLLQLFYYGWRGKLINPLTPVRFPTRPYALLDDLIERFRAAQEKKSLPDAKQALQALFAHTDSAYIPLDEIHYICAGLMAACRQTLPAGFLAAECEALCQSRPSSEVPLDIRKLQYWFGALCDAGFRELSWISPGDPSGKLKQILLYISRHYAEDLSVGDVAAAFSLSSDYFRHYFKKEVGSPFVDYLTAYRIEQSKKLLRSHGCKVSEVASRVGFHSSQYYSMVFRKYEAITPSQYMRKYAYTDTDSI